VNRIRVPPLKGKYCFLRGTEIESRPQYFCSMWSERNSGSPRLNKNSAKQNNVRQEGGKRANNTKSNISLERRVNRNRVPPQKREIMLASIKEKQRMGKCAQVTKTCFAPLGGARQICGFIVDAFFSSATLFVFFCKPRRAQALPCANLALREPCASPALRKPSPAQAQLWANPAPCASACASPAPVEALPCSCPALLTPCPATCRSLLCRSAFRRSALCRSLPCRSAPRRSALWRSSPCPLARRRSAHCGSSRCRSMHGLS